MRALPPENLVRNLDQLSIVIVSVSDDSQENEQWAKGHRKLATARHPVTGMEIRYLSVAVPIRRG